MADLMDYLTWRGDLRFDQAAFCPVDGLILCCLSYVRFEGVVPGWDMPAGVPLRDAAQAFLAQPPSQRVTRVHQDEALLAAAAQTRRFADVRLCGYESRFDPQQERQFAAVTAVLPDGTAAVVYRGTDSTLVGWKEDFNMSFLPVVPAQQDAAAYLVRAAAHTAGPVFVMGHSKGGNLAVYAAASAPDALRPRIKAVWSNDGPGFGQQMLASAGYQAIAGQVQSFVPHSSVVGMLLSHEEAYRVVRSNQVGIWQHDPYSWVLRGPAFDCLDGLTRTSVLLDRTLKNWVAAMAPEQRGAMIDCIYQLFAATNAQTLSELPAAGLRNFHQVRQVWRDTTPENKRMLQHTAQLLWAAARASIARAQEDPPA